MAQDNISNNSTSGGSIDDIDIPQTNRIICCGGCCEIVEDNRGWSAPLLYGMPFNLAITVLGCGFHDNEGIFFSLILSAPFIGVGIGSILTRCCHGYWPCCPSNNANDRNNNEVEYLFPQNEIEDEQRV